MKIDIQSTAPQPMTADQINNLAEFILTRKGNVDFGTTSVTVTPATGFNPFMAGIIVKASSGKVSISGATEITDEDWNKIKAYGATLWMVKAHDDYGISFGNLITAYGYDTEIGKSFNGVGRWLKGDGNSYIDTGWKPNGTAFEIETNFRLVDTNGWSAIYGTYWTDGGICHMYTTNEVIFSTTNKETRRSTNLYTANLEYNVKHSYSTVITIPKGASAITQIIGATTSPTTSRNMWLFAAQNYGKFNGYMSRMIRREATDVKQFFIPMHKDGVNGMYDLIGQQFYGNSGSGTFTIE